MQGALEDAEARAEVDGCRGFAPDAVRSCGLCFRAGVEAGHGEHLAGVHEVGVHRGVHGWSASGTRR